MITSYEKIEEISNAFYDLTRDATDENSDKAIEMINSFTDELMEMAKTEDDKKSVIKFLVQKIYQNHLFNF